MVVLTVWSVCTGLCFLKERQSLVILVEWCPQTLKGWMESTEPCEANRMHVLDKAQEIAVGMRFADTQS